jgi:predicted 2-oxoglutarate/Fe(II)-dependent dioxygenase YbiX
LQGKDFLVTGSSPRLYVHPGFIEPWFCVRIREAMDAGVSEHAEVLDTSFDRREQTRRAASIDPDAALVSDVEARLERVRPLVSRFFGVPLAEREGVGFLRYPSGGFYRPHRDRAAAPSWPDAARRAVALVTFLNDSRGTAVDSGQFEGGTLRLFFEDGPVNVAPQQGLLVAFDADVLHEVTIVRGGVRDTLVDWFYDAPLRHGADQDASGR